MLGLRVAHNNVFNVGVAYGPGRHWLTWKRNGTITTYTVFKLGFYSDYTLSYSRFTIKFNTYLEQFLFVAI